MPIPLLLAPLLATLAEKGLSLIGNAILAKGKDVIEDKLGVNIENALVSEEGLFKLKQLETDHEEFLIEAAQRQAELELEEIRIGDENTAGARHMNEVIQDSEHASYVSKVAPYYLDFLIVGITLGLAAVLFFKGVPPENEKLLYMAFGSLLTMCGTILNFHRGTSSQSKAKDDTINALTK